MNFSALWPWGRTQGRAQRARTAKPAKKTHLTFEVLEDRLSLSASPVTVTNPAYQQWRRQSFVLNDTALAPVSHVADLPAAQAIHVNNSFGADINLNAALASYPYRGDSYSVAVLDTGVDYTHPHLGGGWGKRVIAGYDFVNNDTDPMDDNGHGTHVAGIIGSSSLSYSGVAPNVNIIALKVLDKNGSGNYGAIDDAFQWVASHQAQYNIVALNLSLGSGNYTSNPYSFLETDLAKLKSQGVFLSVAAGNDFYGLNSQPGLAYPATSPNVVSVGAVWAGNFGPVSWGSGARDITTAADRVVSFSQRSSALSIMAPGAIITSTYNNGGYQTMAGTSMASPVVAGAAVLLHQAMKARGLAANQDSILSIMRSTGATITDGDDENDNVINTGLTFKRLDVLAALQNIGQINAGPSLNPIGDQVLREGSARTLTLNGSSGSSSNLTYTATVRDDSGLAYQVKQQLRLTYGGSYFLNAWGANEKWLLDKTGAWIAIMPNGEIRKWAGSIAATLLPAALAATLSPSYYKDPALLLNAQSGGSIPVQVTVVGNRLTLQAPAGYLGSFVIDVTLSDGQKSVAQSFNVTVQNNTAPQLGTIAAQTLFGSQLATIAFSANDTEQDPISYSVSSSIPGAATITVTGAQISVTPAAGFVGEFDVTVTASDGLASSSQTFHVTVYPLLPTTRFVGDFNGDRKTDTVEFRTDGSWWVTLAGGTATLWTKWSPSLAWKSVQVGDFNGDGRTDIVGFNNDGSWWVGISSGASFANSLWSQWSNGAAWNTLLTGDFNKDGKTDIVGFNNDGSWWVGLSTGAAFRTGMWVQWTGAVAWRSVYVADFTGDGRADIAGFNNDGTWWVGQSTGGAFRTTLWVQWIPAVSWNNLMVGDFNADGRADIVGFNNDGSWWVGLSTGGAFATSLWSQWSAANNWTSVFVADYNGDGRADVGGINRDGSTWVGISTTGGFATQLWAQSAPNQKWLSLKSLDINGDRRRDLVGLSTQGTWWVATSTGKGFRWSKR